MLERSIREHSATSEMLIWLCGEKKDWGDLITPDLLWAILAALEREQHSSTGRASKLQRAVVDDRELLGEMFKKIDVGLARDAMRRHLANSLERMKALGAAAGISADRSPNVEAARALFAGFAPAAQP